MEKHIQAKLLQHLRSKGHYAVKVISASQSGTPDILACIRGHFVGIEVKQPGKSATELQEYKARQVREAGGTAWTVTSLDQLKELLTIFEHINHNEDWR